MSGKEIPSAQYALAMSKTNRSFLASQLVSATLIPLLHETINLLELDKKRPSSGFFYDYGSLFNINRLLPKFNEFKCLKGPGFPLPKKVGDIELESVLLSEKEYINHILSLAGKAGYRTAWVMKDGIIFFLHIGQMGEKSRLFYQNFFLSRQKVYLQIKELVKKLVGGELDPSRKNEILELKIQGKPLNHIVLKYPCYFSEKDIQLINYEMSIFYQKMNFSSYIFSDLNQLKPHDLETPIEPTTLKIFFQLPRIIDNLLTM